ncbi:Hypothetical protein POVR1_LOCUS182 [uncultured virus]|nr:Hypothetical protein POVR1_LOCUS182 [uncultured virus]
MSEQLQIIISTLIAACHERGYIPSTLETEYCINKAIVEFNLQETPEGIELLINTLLKAGRIYQPEQSDDLLFKERQHPIDQFR